MLINLRNALMAGKRLPYDAEVEYLECAGTSSAFPYINTGIVGDSNTTYEAMLWRNTQAKNECAIGSWNSGNTRCWIAYYSSNKFYLGMGAQVNSAGTPQPNVWYKQTLKIESSKFNLYIDDGLTTTVPQTTFTSNQSLYIGAMNSSGTASFYFRGRFGAVKIYQGAVLVRDFIPVRKGNVGYLYDRVSGKLFGNEGTGDFQYGQDVVPVEYIENVASSYINTEFKADNACKFEIDFENKKTDGNYNPWLFGSRNGSVSAVDKSCVFLGYTNGTSYAMMGSAMPTFNQGLVVSGRHTLTMSLSEGVGIDGVAVATYTPSEQAQIYTNTHPDALFSMWNGSSLSNYFIGRVYSFKVLKNGIPQIDFQPIRVGTEGAMMDVLTRRVYRNAGTGAFTYGNDLKYPIPA